MTALQTVRGMHDVLPEKSIDYFRVESKAREIFSLFGYRELRTPVLESLSLFERALGQTTDIVEKEMFTLKDRGDRTLCLRPEGTAGIVRSLIENNLNQKFGVTKLFYVGPMFRAERPQKGRFREFVQIGSEYFGNESPAADAETILLALRIVRASGIRSVEVRLNSIGCPECRPAYQLLLLKFLNERASELCSDCQKRMEKNPLRALDCKTDAEKLQEAPQSQNSLCAACAEHYGQVKNLLASSGTEFTVTPHLVRGLDYYSRTVFEIYPSDKSGSQDALAAGGRYDALVQSLGGPAMPAVGFALGLERILNQVSEQGQNAEAGAEPSGVFVANLGPAALEKSFQLLNQLRAGGISAQGTLNNQSLKSQMRLADKMQMRFCVIIGENELKKNAAAVRDMKSQTQEEVPLDRLADLLKERMKLK